MPALTILNSTPANAAPALATTSCGFNGDASPFSSGSISIVPLHGKAVYTDIRNKIDATYIGYKITNSSGSAKNGLWLKLDNFRDVNDAQTNSVLKLANPSDEVQPIGDLANGASAYVYFLIKAKNVTEIDQFHDVRLFNVYPTADTEPTAKCKYTFQSVVRVLAASANKVTSITLTGTPKIGGSISIVINGQTGQAGSGSASPDGDVMWVSGASNSLWPTTALRLETISTTVLCRKTGNTLPTYSNQLLIKGISTACSGNKPFSSATTYTTTFTYRVMGGAPTNPAVSAISNISSGTQIKHTGSFPNTVTVPLTDVEMTATATKNWFSTTSPAIDGSATTPVLTAGSKYWEVTYTIVLSDSVQSSLDKIIDDPEPGMFYKTNSVRITDFGRSNATTSEPTNIGTVNDPNYVFSGPFKLTGSSSSWSATLKFTMYLLVPTTTYTYTNKGYGYIGTSIVGQVITDSSSGSYASKISVAKVTINSGPTVPPVVIVDPPPVDPPLQDQIIDFPAIPNMSVGGTYTLNAVASSGLAVTYTVNNASLCTVAGVTLTARVAGSGCIVTASQSGNSTWNAATPVDNVVTVLSPQSIVFEPTLTMAVSSSQTKAGTSSSGLDIFYTIITPDVCTFPSPVSPNTTTSRRAATGTIITISTTSLGGNCVVTADQPGDATYGPAPTVEKIIAVGTPQTIVFPTITNAASASGTKTVTATTTITSNGNALDLPITFTSSTPLVCSITVDSTQASNSPYATSQVLNLLTVGTCIIVASQDGFDASGAISAYAPATDVTRTFTIGSGVPTVTITPSSSRVASGSTFTATVRVASTTTGTPTGTIHLYLSGDASGPASPIVATLTSGVTASLSISTASLSPGSTDGHVYLTADYLGDGTFSTSTTTVRTDVAVEPPPSINSILISSTPATLSTYKLGATISIQVTFSSAVVVTGTPQITVVIGSTNTLFSYASGSATNVLTFSRATELNESDSNGISIIANPIVLNGGTIKSTLGTDTFRDFAAQTDNSGHKVDAVPPTATISSTSSGTMAQGGTRALTITLSETATDFATGDLTISALGGSVGSITGSGTSYSVTFTMGSASSATISVSASKFTDPVGNSNVASNNFVIDATGYSTVIFNKNDGSNETYSQTANTATNLTSNTFSRIGYTFGGWGAQTPYGVTYLNSASYSFTSGTTLYAQWFGISYSGGTSTSSGVAKNSVSATKSGGTTPIAEFTLTGTVPSGVTIDATSGVISADANVAQGTYTLNVSAKDSATSQLTATTTTTLSVVATPVISYSSSVTTTVGISVTSVTPTATGGVGTIGSYTITAGSTAGISIDPTTGVVTLTNGVAGGSYTLTIRAQDSNGTTTTTTLQVLVNGPPQISYSSNVSATFGSSKNSVTPTASGGTGTIGSYTITTGGVASITINSTSGVVIVGSTTPVATYTLSISAVDANTAEATTTLTITVVAAPSISYSSNLSPTYGTSATSVTPTVSGGVAPISDFTIRSGGATGITINSTTGVVTYDGSASATTYTLSIRATDANSVTADTTLTVIVGRKSITITVTNQSKNFGEPIPSNAFTAATLVSPDAISGMTYVYYDSTGTTAISGEPTAVGTYKIRSSLPVFSTGFATNYTISHTDGTLTINRATRTISLSSISNLTDWGATAPTYSTTISAGPNDGTKTYSLDGTSSGCSIDSSSGALTITGPGTCKISATIGVGNDYQSATTASLTTFTIGQKSQILTLASTTLPVSAATHALSASTNASSNNSGLGSFVYSISNSPNTSSTGCSITEPTTGNFVLNFDRAGNCYVQVTKTGNTYWTNGSTITDFTISSKTSRSIRIKNKTEAATSYDSSGYSSWGATAPILESAISAGESDGVPLNYTLDPNSSGCTVTNASTGALSFTGAGTCKVKVAIGEGTTYSSATSEVISFEIGKKPHSITMPTVANQTFSSSISINTLPSGSSESRSISFVSTDTDVCTVSGTTITGKKTGTCTITASSPEDGNYLAATGTLVTTFVINPKRIDLAPEGKTITFGDSTAENTFVHTALEVISGTIDAIGTVAFKYFDGETELASAPTQAGTYTIKASSANFARGNPLNYEITYNTATYTINKKPRTITLAGISNLSDWGGSTIASTPTINHGSTDGTKTYSLGTESTGCEVDSSTGVITPTGAGTCKVKATITGGTNHSDANSSEISFTIGQRNQLLTFANRSISLSSGNHSLADPANAATSNASANTSGLGNFVYAISGGYTSATGCGINADGITLEFNQSGVCYVQVTRSGNTHWTNGAAVVAAITVNGKSSRGIQITNADFVTDIWSIANWGASPKTITSEADNEDNDGTKSYTTEGTDPSICTVNATTGVVTFNGAGDCVVKASIGEGTNFNSANSTTKILRIGKKDHTITIPELASKTVGDTDQEIPSTTSEGQTITYTITDPTVCEIVTVGGVKKVKALKAGDCSITANNPGNSNYNPASGSGGVLSRTFRVTGGATTPAAPNPVIPISPTPQRQTPVVVWKNPAPIRFTTPIGDPQLNAKATLLSAVTTQILDPASGVQLPSSAPRVPGTYKYVVEPGTILTPGVHKLKVIFTPDDLNNYSIVESEVEIKVLLDQKAKPNLNWNNPNPIIQGTPLSKKELNAEADVKGRYEYEKVEGTVLPNGKQLLKVKFIPDDLDNYEILEKTVEIYVVKVIEPTPNRIVTPSTKQGSQPIGNVTNKATGVVNSIGLGITKVTVSGAQVNVTPNKVFSGNTSVKILVNDEGQEKLVTVPVTILPVLPANPVSTPTSYQVSQIKWERSPNAVRYVVTVNKEVVCNTSLIFCSVSELIGPKTAVSIQALGRDNTKSETLKVGYKAPTTPVLAAVEGFATASSKLTEQSKVDLRKFALEVKAAGFTRLQVYGHTDSRGGVDNQLLSENRAKAAIAYLKQFLPGVQFRVAGFASNDPIADETNEGGLAANRRVEISLW